MITPHRQTQPRISEEAMTTFQRGIPEYPFRSPVEILDCTLRDGSYSVDFQFSEEVITNVLSGLEMSGVRYVELGHGLGLNAGTALDKQALVSDERCFEIAASTLREARWGMFCIPGIARTEHLRQAAAAGMRFVRVGVDITDVTPAQEFIELAGELGLITFANLMKTNVLDTDEVATAVARCAGFGALGVYLVDSVGGYLPTEVEPLFRRIAETVDVPLGFHGHDNLGLANANAIAAMEGGAHFVDTTLDGIGRGAGNANTEVFAAILRSRGTSTYDYRALGRLSEDRMRPLTRLHDDRLYQLVGALTQTHSSFFPLITRCAESVDIDVFELMEVVADINRVNPTEELVMRAASDLATACAA
jgi:4-hydroxy-2-oxovalerate aldolase